MTGFWAWFHDGWEIIGAIASAAAVIVAVWLASHERADRKAAELERDEARKAQRRAEMAEARRERETQARAVAFWVDHVHGPRDFIAQVGNYSDRPIFNARFVTLESGVWSEATDVPGVTVLPGGTDAEGFGDWERTQDGWLWHGMPAVEHSATHDQFRVEVALRFRDVAGNHWLRLISGKLLDAPPVLHG